MKEYETVLVLKPDQAEAETNQLLDRINSTIGRHGGVVLQQNNWGKREMAYKVDKYRHGHYFYYNYSGDNLLVTEIERMLKLHDLPMKYLTVKLSETVDIEARKQQIAAAKTAPEKTEKPADPVADVAMEVEDA